MNSKTFYKLLLVVISVFFIATGVAFNAASLLGNDPIGILYDGIRNTLNLSVEQLGFVSNCVNGGVLLIVFLFGRKYINIGTLLYFLPYGTFVNWGNKIYPYLFQTDSYITRIAAASCGCLLIYIGVGIFIAMNIGLDPFSGLVLVIRDKLKWDYSKVKIFFDLFLVIISVLMGGKIGLVTIVTAFSAGPSIQFVTKMTAKLFKNSILAVE